MTPIIAQADLSSLPAGFMKNMVVFLVASIAAASFVSTGIFAALQYFLDKRRAAKAATEIQPRMVHPIPLPVEMVEKFVEHKTFDAHVVDTKQQFEKRDIQRHEDLTEASRSRKTIYDKIDDARSENSTLANEVRKELSDKIDSLPDRVIVTLKNTGAI